MVACVKVLEGSDLISIYICILVQNDEYDSLLKQNDIINLLFMKCFATCVLPQAPCLSTQREGWKVKWSWTEWLMFATG